ncbi:hypothetical protein JB92DRAFT_2834506 [Gautieria morchelliformis]|nr:hypothetical protein JB92DRAFT_2834506 [Gautieria morchelliformis]
MPVTRNCQQHTEEWPLNATALCFIRGLALSTALRIFVMDAATASARTVCPRRQGHDIRFRTSRYRNHYWSCTEERQLTKLVRKPFPPVRFQCKVIPCSRTFPKESTQSTRTLVPASVKSWYFPMDSLNLMGDREPNAQRKDAFIEY